IRPIAGIEIDYNVSIVSQENDLPHIWPRHYDPGVVFSYTQRPAYIVESFLPGWQRMYTQEESVNFEQRKIFYDEFYMNKYSRIHAYEVSTQGDILWSRCTINN